MTSASQPPKPIEIFFSYSHADEALRDELEKHLSILKWRGVITGWHDRKIGVGREWEGQIDTKLNQAQVILLLISPDFMASNYCYDIELKRALERHESGEALVIPIILRPVDWKMAPFARLQALPKNGKPVVSWRPRDKAFENVAISIREEIQRMEEKRESRSDINKSKPNAGPVQRVHTNVIPGGMNPYIAGPMIADKTHFFGRERELRETFDWLRTMHSVSVVGESRIGRSSFIYRVSQSAHDKLGVNYQCFYLDFQRILSSAEFYERVCTLLGSNGNTHLDMERIVNQTRDKKTILCLDEFEGTMNNPAFSGDFFKVLRSFAATGEISLVTATQRTLFTLYQERAIPLSGGSPFYNIFKLVTLGPLTDDAAHALVTKPAEGVGLAFTEDEVSFVLKLVMEHLHEFKPFWLNLACSLMFDRKIQSDVDFTEVKRRFEDALRAYIGEV